jgi:hypothetical protein
MASNAAEVEQMKAFSLLVRTLPDESKRVLRTEGKRLVEPLVSRVRRNLTAVRAGRYIAPTVRVGSKAGWPTIRIGNSGLAGALFYGTEFGSNHATKRTYTSRRGTTLYPVTRHTTRQFPQPHTPPGPSAGRYFYPALRAESARITEQYGQAVLRTLEATR